jgi:glycosyltransferase involved in cell wall biosynthesis
MEACPMPKISIITVTKARPQLLAQAIASLQAQTNQDFEWIIVNDGGDTATEELIFNSKFNCSISYCEMPHPANGFGLARDYSHR